jgi:hypothetical protein
LGHPQLDRYLEFVAARARPNTVLATGYNLKAFFSVVSKDPVEVTTSDVFGFIIAQRGGFDRPVGRHTTGIIPPSRLWAGGLMLRLVGGCADGHRVLLLSDMAGLG